MVATMRLIGLLAALLLPSLLHAGEADKPLEIHLMSETRSITAGKPFFLGLHLVHPPGSHTYWKHPGIVGLATTVEWELPPGFRAGEIQWPAPQVVKMAGYEAQGYEGETLLLIPITPPEILSADTATLTARVSWMCCGKICEPAVKIPFSVTLPISNSAEADPSTQAMFEKFRALVPRNEPAWKAAVKRERGKIILTLKPPGAISNPGGIHFFSSDGQVDSNQKQQVDILSNGAIQMTLTRSQTAPELPVPLPGVVNFKNGDSPASIEIKPCY